MLIPVVREIDLKTVDQLKQINQDQIKQFLGENNANLSDMLITALNNLSLND